MDAGKYTIQYIGGDTIRVAGKGNSVIDSLVNKEMDKYGFEEVLTMAENDLIHDRNINKKDYTTVGAYVTASYADTFRKYSQISKKYGKQSVVG